VDAPLQKNHLSSGERIVKVDQEGKPSVTIFSEVQKFTNATLVEAALLTGRTHQIRVHARYRGHPLAGDEKYGDREFNKYIREFGLKRIFLHSHWVEFTLASTGQKISVKAPLDPDLEACINKLS
jgi:23S rRNA pseudouridine955/2504/2580 synthase